MDFEPTVEQTELIDLVEKLTNTHIWAGAPFGTHRWNASFDAALAEVGLLDVGSFDGFSGLEAVLVIDAAARTTSTAEIMASNLIRGIALSEDLPRPLALVGDVGHPARFLDIAKTACILEGNEGWIVSVAPDTVEEVDGIAAFPVGRFKARPDLSSARRLSRDEVEAVRRWWSIGLAAEAGGAMRAALDFTTEYVTNRRQFGRPIGSFQAVQHRLAAAAVHTEGVRWLAREAAFRGDQESALIAIGYAQLVIPEFVYDLHQFNGALGQTLEHDLHYWTYRLTTLAGELGGMSSQMTQLAEALWGPKG